MFRKTFVLIFAFLSIACARDICDSATNYRLYESSKKCVRLGNNLACATLGLIALAGLSAFSSKDMPLFFLEMAPLPMLASLPFYITGGVKRSIYNRDKAKCGGFGPAELGSSSGIGPPVSPSAIAYCISVGFDF